MSTPPEHWHSMHVEEAVNAQGSDGLTGLRSEEAHSRLRTYGENRLPERRPTSPLVMLLGQVKNIMIGLLAVAAAFALLTGQTLDAIAIAAVIAANTALGFVIEFRAEKASAALKHLFITSCRVVRGGQVIDVPTTDVVPGDIMILEAGFRVLADARVTATAELSVDESALTGESVPVEKECDTVLPKETVVADRINMVYTGTLVVRGRGQAVVVATGADTEMAKISTLMSEGRKETTPLQKRINNLMRYVLILVGLIAITVTAVGIFRGEDVFLMIETGIAIAVAAVPEGMPAVITISLAIGVRRMASRNAIIRRLAAVESLGNVELICSDKTGTMTLNQMTVREVIFGSGNLRVGGSGYSPEGTLELQNHGNSSHDNPCMRLSMAAGMLCNDSSLSMVDGKWKGSGDPTEIALLSLGMKAGLSPASLSSDFPRLREVPFQTATRMMATVHPAEKLPAFLTGANEAGKFICFVKGSPESLIDAAGHYLQGERRIPLDGRSAEEWKNGNLELAGRGYRVLATAFKLMDSVEDDTYTDLTLLSLVGMHDPPRPEAKASVALCRNASIRVVMITGDQKETARKIASDLGIGRDGGIVVTEGAALSAMSGSEFVETVQQTDVFARVSPEQKLEIVRALRESGPTVAMTGDGINDAPALEAADIGISMGRGGTDVAREASDVILVDDNFSSIISAVEEGRIAFANIRKFVSYLFSCNFSELFIMLAATFAGIPLPLLAIQILWLNLVTDVLPAMSLISEKADEDIMKHPPVKTLSGGSLYFAGNIFSSGLFMTAAGLTAFLFELGSSASTESSTTAAFLTMALSQTLHVFNERFGEGSMFSRRLFTNRYVWAAAAGTIALILASVFLSPLSTVLKTSVPSVEEWTVILAASFLPLVLSEVYKLVHAAGRLVSSRPSA